MSTTLRCEQHMVGSHITECCSKSEMFPPVAAVSPADVLSAQREDFSARSDLVRVPMHLRIMT